MEDMVNLFLQTSNDFYDLIRVINKYSVIKDWMKANYSELSYHFNKTLRDLKKAIYCIKETTEYQYIDCMNAENVILWKSCISQWRKTNIDFINYHTGNKDTMVNPLIEHLGQLLHIYATPRKPLLLCIFADFHTENKGSIVLEKRLFELKNWIARNQDSLNYASRLNSKIRSIKQEISAQEYGEHWEDFFTYTESSVQLNKVQIGRFIYHEKMKSKSMPSTNEQLSCFYSYIQEWQCLLNEFFSIRNSDPTQIGLSSEQAKLDSFPFAVEAKEQPLSHDVPVSEETQTSTALPPAPAERDKPFQAPEEANCLAGAVLRDEAVFQAFVERLREAASFIYQRTNKRMTAWKWCFLLYALRDLQLIDKETSYKAFAVMVAALVPQPDMTAEQQANNIKSNVQYHIAKSDTANDTRNQKLVMSIKAHFLPVADLVKGSRH